MNSVPEPKNVIYGLYCVCAECERDRPGEIRYVGQTSAGVVKRFRTHLHDAKRGAPWAVCRWIYKHGYSNICYQVLEEVSIRSDLTTRENHWIATLDTLVRDGGHGLNLIAGRDHPGRGSGVPRKRKPPGSSGNRKTTEAVVSKIKYLLWTGESVRSIVSSVGVGYGSVSAISTGKTWVYVPWPIGPRRAPSPWRFTTQECAGEKSPRAVLTDRDVKKIRAGYKGLPGEVKKLASEYGMTYPGMYCVVTRRSWRHLD